MDNSKLEMIPMSIDIQQDKPKGKYPKIGPDHICVGFGFAILSSAIGGACCAVSLIVGEWYYQKHKYHPENHIALYDISKVGMLGGAVTDLVLYIIILMYACNFDPKRNIPSNRDMGCSSTEMICCPESPVGYSCCEAICCPILILFAFHALNMLLSGSLGYWIYTRNRKIALDFDQSMEALAMGIALTMIPLCFANICLFTAYSNFKISTSAPQPFTYSGSRPPLVVFDKKTDEERLRDDLEKQKNENSRLRRTGIF